MLKQEINANNVKFHSSPSISLDANEREEMKIIRNSCPSDLELIPKFVAFATSKLYGEKSIKNKQNAKELGGSKI